MKRRNRSKGNVIRIMYMLDFFFEGDDSKIWAWLTTPNPTVGCIPATLIECGHAAKLKRIIAQLIEENEVADHD